MTDTGWKPKKVVSIEFYKSGNGREPVRAWLKSLPKSHTKELKIWRNNMAKHKHVGSNFDDFLQEEGLLEECEALAAKRVFVYQLEKEMRRQRLTKTELAQRMHTSRSSVNRVLNPNQPSNLTLLGEAARAVGRHLRLSIV